MNSASFVDVGRRARPPEDPVGEPEEAVASHHVPRRLVQFDRVLALIGEAGVLGRTLHRVERVPAVHRVRDVRVEAEHEHADDEGGADQGHVAHDQVAAPPQAVQPAGQEEEAEVHEARELDVHAERAETNTTSAGSQRGRRR